MSTLSTKWVKCEGDKFCLNPLTINSNPCTFYGFVILVTNPFIISDIVTKLVDHLSTQTITVMLRVVRRTLFLQWYQDHRNHQDAIMEVPDLKHLRQYETCPKWGTHPPNRRWMIGTCHKWNPHLHKRQWHCWYLIVTLISEENFIKTNFRMEELLLMRKMLIMITHQNGNIWEKVSGKTR